MKKIDTNTWILLGALAVFVLGAVLMGIGGEVASAIGRCCF